MPYTTALPSGKRRINKIETFVGVLGGALPEKNLPFSRIFENFDQAVLSEYSSVTKEALSNCHGDWFEWLLAIAAWNCFKKNNFNKAALFLPKISQFDCSKLYKNNLFEMIQHLRDEVQRNSGVSLITSNPDFAIIEHKKLNEVALPKKITSIDADLIANLENAYSKFIEECEFESIRGYIAAKFSFRPDRRLQVPHEGSLMKALYVHLQTRLWITEPRGLKYYAIATAVSESDRNALSTVATHSITTVSSKAQSAVDGVFEAKNMKQAEDIFYEILRIN